MTTEPKPETPDSRPWYVKGLTDPKVRAALLVLVTFILTSIYGEDAKRVIDEIVPDKVVEVAPVEVADGDEVPPVVLPVNPEVAPPSVPEPAPPTVPELPAVDLPESVAGAVGAFVRVTATTNGREVRWFAATPGLNVFPPELLKDSRTAVVTAPSAGTYTLVGYTALRDVPSLPDLCVVTIGAPPVVAPPPVQPPPITIPPPVNPVEPLTPVAPATSLVLFLYESSAGSLPPYVAGAINQLRASGRTVYIADVDDRTGLDAMPTWMQPAVEPAKAVGLPAMAHIADGKLVKPPVKVPATLQAIISAVNGQ